MAYFEAKMHPIWL